MPRRYDRERERERDFTERERESLIGDTHL